MDILNFFMILIVVGLGGLFITGLLFSLFLMTGPSRHETFVDGVIIFLGILVIIGMLGVAVIEGV